MPEAHVACLRMLEPVMTMREGERIYAPAGRLLEPGEVLQQPGLVRALERVAEEGARSAYEGTIGESLVALLAERGGAVTRDDLHTCQARWNEPVEIAYADTSFLTRAGLAPVGPALERLPRLRGLPEPERTLVLLDAVSDDDEPCDRRP
jgi:gamma-glutamyltranspeptidase